MDLQDQLLAFSHLYGLLHAAFTGAVVCITIALIVNVSYQALVRSPLSAAFFVCLLYCFWRVLTEYLGFCLYSTPEKTAADITFLTATVIVAWFSGPSFSLYVAASLAKKKISGRVKHG